MALQGEKGEYLILVHGLGRTWRSMKTPQKFLQKQGYQVFNLNYPSTKYTIETLVRNYLEDFIRTHCREPMKKIHFVAHSMGGILVRYYLKHYSLDHLGRVVMLAPPNQGSELVDQEKHWGIFRWLLGPAGQQLGTDAESLPIQLGPVDFEAGVIAGDRSVEFHHSWLIPGADDGKVAVERAKVQGMKDFLIVHKAHTFIMNDDEVLRQIAHFLKTGHFQRDTNTRVV